VFVTLIDLTPVDKGVYVNVPDVAPLFNVMDDGVNVPPPLESDGVTSTDDESEPFAATVKFVDAVLTTPDDGPDSVSAVATPLVAVYVIELGLDNPPLLVTLIVFAPDVAGVYVNVAVVEPLLIFTVVGVNVPPPPLSLGVTVTVPVIVPSAPTVKFVDAVPTDPELGPESVTDVAAVLASSAVTS